MYETTRHRLPLLATAQAQKEITHNEALMAIDRLLHPVVESRGLTVPSDAPQQGMAWIVPTAATGSWTEASGSLAVANAGGWSFIEPRPGMAVWVRDEQCFVTWDAQWTTLWPVCGLSIDGRSVLSAPPNVVAAPAGGLVVDAEARVSIAALIEALRLQGITA
jgi:hypothetical protein